MNELESAPCHTNFIEVVCSRRDVVRSPLSLGLYLEMGE
jgi:hypothetical protein